MNRRKKIDTPNRAGNHSAIIPIPRTYVFPPATVLKNRQTNPNAIAVQKNNKLFIQAQKECIAINA